MTTTLQTINGHQYLVTTDAKGNVVSEVGCDPIAPPAHPAAALLTKTPTNWTPADLAAALQLILKALFT